MLSRSERDERAAQALRERACSLGVGPACDLAMQRETDPAHAEQLRRSACEYGGPFGCAELAREYAHSRDFSCAEAFAQRACQLGEPGSCDVANACRAPRAPTPDIPGARIVERFLAASPEAFISFVGPSLPVRAVRLRLATDHGLGRDRDERVRQMLADTYGPEAAPTTWAEQWTGCTVRAGTDSERAWLLPTVFNVAPSAFVRKVLLDEVERTRLAEVYVATCRCVPGMAVVVDPTAQKILARNVLPDLLSNLSAGQGRVRLELESDAGASITIDDHRMMLPTQLEQLDEGAIVHATVEAPGRPALAFDRMVSGGLAGEGVDHWFIVLPRAP